MFRSKNKYSISKVSEADGSRTYDSALERALLQLLHLREKAGEIEDIKHQVTVYLTDARVMSRPDYSFVLCATGDTWYAEAKGFETALWRIKRRLWTVYGPGPLEIWKGTAREPVLHEIITPKKEETYVGPV
jgi:hypothetical protein